MKQKIFTIIAILMIASLLLAACGPGEDAGEPGGPAAQELDRPDPPAPYAGMTNPHGGDANAEAAGQTIYQTNCASCHGEGGAGDGPAAATLDPPPQDLAENIDGLDDSYLFWRIAEGGGMEPFNSAMPAWKGILSEDEIWQVISYMRTLG